MLVVVYGFAILLTGPSVIPLLVVVAAGIGGVKYLRRNATSRTGAKTFSTDFLGVAESIFAPGEKVLDSCTMLYNSIPNMVLLTNRNIRLIQFARQSFPRRYVAVISGSTSIPLHEIRAMSVVQKKIKGHSAKMIEVSARTVLESHSLISNIEAGSIAFGQACERAFQDKVGLEQAKFVGDAIGRLAVLLDEGLISSEEFEHAKKGLVGKPTSRGDEIVGLLRQLHSLHQSGVLTAGEFRLKKWDILSKQ